MQNRDEEELDEDFFSNVSKIRKTAKEDMLDETFKKAAATKGFQSRIQKKITKKPFLKLGVVLIFIAVLSLAVINFMPWMFVKCQVNYREIQESYILEDIGGIDALNNEILYIFESPCANCSNNSKNFIGLTSNDFSETSQTSTYGFYALMALGIAFTIIEIFRKVRNIHGDATTIIHSAFALASCIVGVYLLSLFIKFFGAYFLLFYNKSFIEASGVNNLVIIFPTTLVLTIVSFAVILVSTSVMKINFHEFEKRLISMNTQSTLSTFKFGNSK